MIRRVLALAAIVVFPVISLVSTAKADERVDSVAREYVKLVLRAGKYIPDYIDAYFGPSELKEDAAREEVEKGFPYDRLCEDADRLIARISAIGPTVSDDSPRRRLHFMLAQLTSLRGVLDRQHGKTLTFDQEASAIYGVQAPHHDSAYYETRLAALDSLLPGKGDIRQRYMKYHERFVVPKNRVDTLMKVCLAECRARTSNYLALPQGEDCRVELVGGQSWGAYNWYLGDLQSLIQIDTTTTVHIGNLIGLAAHEGYPGHHCSNIIREKHLVRDSGWVEYSVFPLFSPMSVLDEGTANYGVDMVLSPVDRVAFYQNTLFPLAGLDPSEAPTYCLVLDVMGSLDGAGADVAQLYLDGLRDKTQSIAWLGYYVLQSEAEAVKSLSFYDDYRSYIVTYSVGKALVADCEARHGGTLENPAKRWGIFHSLIATPTMLSDLR